MYKKILIFLSLIFSLLFNSAVIWYFISMAPNFILTIILSIYISSLIWGLLLLRQSYRRLESRIRWFLTILFIPCFGFLLFIIIGKGYKYKNTVVYPYKNKKQKTTNKTLNELKILNIHHYELFDLAWKEQNANILKNQKITIFDRPDMFFENLIKDIQKSKKKIFINFYIISDGRLLNIIINELIISLKKGVEVYIIYDFIGSFTVLSKKNINILKKYGAKITSFSRIKLPSIYRNINYRNHRKDILIDDYICYLGGTNIGDEYISMSSKFGFWNDTQLRLEGSISNDIKNIFINDWFFLKKELIKSSSLKPEQIIESKNKDIEFTQIISSGPNHTNYMHIDIILKLIQNAKKSIIIETPYFIPPKEIMNALEKAIKSGVKVKIILPGLSDKMFILNISKHWALNLQNLGAEIIHWKNTFSHSKNYIIDNDIVFTGSTNLDYRSLISDQQTMVLIYSKKINTKIRRIINKNSHKQNKIIIQEKNIFKKIFMTLIIFIAPLL